MVRLLINPFSDIRTTDTRQPNPCVYNGRLLGATRHGTPSLCMVLKRNKVLALQCSNSFGFDVVSRDEMPVKAFAEVYRRHMFLEPPIYEEPD